MATELKYVAQATATRLLFLTKTFNKCIATSPVIFLPSTANTRRRFPAIASITNTVIHVTTVVLTITTTTKPATKTTTITRMTDHMWIDNHHDPLRLLSYHMKMNNDRSIKNKHDVDLIMVMLGE
ncbi:hypothetical protein Hanom_Chr07g00593511 [Helianthus anomalus]